MGAVWQQGSKAYCLHMCHLPARLQSLALDGQDGNNNIVAGLPAAQKAAV